MAYNGSVELISGIIPKNNQDFPLVDAKDVRIDDETRLDEALTGLKGDLKNMSDISGFGRTISDIAIRLSDLKWVTSINNSSRIIECTPGDVVSIVSNSSQGYMCLLKSLNGVAEYDSADCSEIIPGIRTINANTIVSYIVPSDANYIWFFDDEENTRLPIKIYINGINILSSVKESLERINANKWVLSPNELTRGAYQYANTNFNPLESDYWSTEYILKFDTDVYIHYNNKYDFYIKTYEVVEGLISGKKIYRPITECDLVISKDELFTITIKAFEDDASQALDTFEISKNKPQHDDTEFSHYLISSSTNTYDVNLNDCSILQKVSDGDKIKISLDDTAYYWLLNDGEVFYGRTANRVDDSLHTLSKGINYISIPENCEYILLYKTQLAIEIILNDEYDILNGINLLSSGWEYRANGDLFEIINNEEIMSDSLFPVSQKNSETITGKNIVAINHDDLAEEDWKYIRKVYNKYGFNANFSVIVTPFANLEEQNDKCEEIKQLVRDGNDLGLHAFFGASFWWMNKLWDIRPNLTQTFAPSIETLKASYQTHKFSKTFSADSTLEQIGYSSAGNTSTIGTISGTDFKVSSFDYALAYGNTTITGLDLTGKEQSYTRLKWLEYWYNSLIDSSMGYSNNSEDVYGFFVNNYELPDGVEKTRNNYNTYYPDAEHLLNGKIVFFDDTTNLNYSNPDYQIVGRFKKGLFKGHASCCNYEVEDLCIKIAKAFCKHYFGTEKLTAFDRHGVKFVNLHYMGSDGITRYDDADLKCLAGEFGTIYDTNLGIFETQQDILLRNGITCSTHFTPIDSFYEGQLGLYYGQFGNKYPYFWASRNYGGVFTYLDVIGSTPTWKNESYSMDEIFSYLEEEKDWLKYVYENTNKTISKTRGSGSAYVHPYLRQCINTIRESYQTNLIPVLSLDTISKNASDNVGVELLCQYCVKSGIRIVPLETARRMACGFGVDYKHNYFPNPTFNQMLLQMFGGESTSKYAYVPEGWQIWSSSELNDDIQIQVVDEGNYKALELQNNGNTVTLTTRMYGLPSGEYTFSLKGRALNATTNLSVQVFLQKNNDTISYKVLYAEQNLIAPVYSYTFNNTEVSEATTTINIPERIVFQNLDVSSSDAIFRGYGENVCNIMVLISIRTGDYCRIWNPTFKLNK